MTVDSIAHRRWAWATIDLDAVEHNVALLRARSAPAALWAVVKADGYGHGSVPVSFAALRAGAAGLCVALVQEGVELRAAGIDAPILVFGEQPIGQLDDLIEHHLTPTVYTAAYVDALAARAGERIDVHVNVDTGMQRVGVPPSLLADLLATVRAHSPQLAPVAIYTHLACADEPDHPANDQQMTAFDRVIDDLGEACPPIVHVGNSAAALAFPRARRSFVRAGIAIYGISPGAGVDDLCAGLRPAMSLEARVSHVKRVPAGSSVSYGWRHRFDHATTVATVPLGYADGVPRRLGTLPDRTGADVLIGGRRHPIVGVVTMDQLMVDVGDHDVGFGEPVVLIGRQGDESITVAEWADRLGTIGYEIVCGIASRVPRAFVGGSGAAMTRASARSTF
ncbi:MAG: alanine racemase [Ilumatobacteraceae bacterium]